MSESDQLSGTGSSAMQTAVPAAAPADFIAGGRSVAAGRGWAWIAGAWAFFLKQPFLWFAEGFFFFLIVAVLPNFPPLIGFIVSSVVTPAVIGGLMLGCAAQHGGQRLKAGHLFAGFQNNAGGLLVAGLVWLLCLTVITVVAVLIVGIGFFKAIAGTLAAGGAAETAGAIMAIVIGSIATIATALLIALALLIPVTMLFWFAPALIVFNNLAPLAAMRSSFAACLGNMTPFLVYGVIMLMLGLLACLPAVLLPFLSLLAWLVLMTLILISIYTAYRDIFYA
jgi:hypothetical protein